MKQLKKALPVVCGGIDHLQEEVGEKEEKEYVA
jgi:hypothetical protein